LRIQRHLFWIISRTAIATYSRLPIFGALRASVGVIRNGELVLVIDRNDGRGLSFPGGVAWPWETSEACLRREVSEETGLRVKSAAQMFEYHSTADVPVKICVFEIETEGELEDSWEGSPVWMALSEIRPRLLPSQKPIVDRLTGH
jgi:8-oxo-dGTP pyrophosphatase MutT (NUDIX family)